jgi:hypothetical protein
MGKSALPAQLRLLRPSGEPGYPAAFVSEDGGTVKTVARLAPATEALPPEVEAYLAIATAFSRCIVRIWAAEAAEARLLLAGSEFRAHGQFISEGPTAAVLQHLVHLPDNSLEALRDVTNVSHLLYATALFDTFLSETTRFLFLLIPRAIGEDHPVPMRALLEADARNEAVTSAAHDRAREIGHQPFARRIELLQDIFGLKLSLSAPTLQALAHFSSMHSSALHDQGAVRLELGSLGEVVASREGCTLHPAKLNADDVHCAIDSYEQSARSIAGAVFTQILKQGENPAVQLLLKGSTAMLELHPS